MGERTRPVFVTEVLALLSDEQMAFFKLVTDLMVAIRSGDKQSRPYNQGELMVLVDQRGEMLEEVSDLFRHWSNDLSGCGALLLQDGEELSEKMLRELKVILKQLRDVMEIARKLAM
jgi:hypothetical protein